MQNFVYLTITLTLSVSATPVSEGRQGCNITTEECNILRKTSSACYFYEYRSEWRSCLDACVDPIKYSNGAECEDQCEQYTSRCLDGKSTEDPVGKTSAPPLTSPVPPTSQAPPISTSVPPTSTQAPLCSSTQGHIPSPPVTELQTTITVLACSLCVCAIIIVYQCICPRKYGRCSAQPTVNGMSPESPQVRYTVSANCEPLMTTQTD